MVTISLILLFAGDPTAADINCRAASVLAFAALNNGTPAQPQPAPQPEPKPQPAPEPQPAPKISAPQALIFSRSDCLPCKQLAREIKTVLVPAGWTIGPTKMIRFYDVPDGGSEISKKHKITDESPIPQIVVVRDGKEIGRIVGYLRGKQLAEELNKISTGWGARK